MENGDQLTDILKRCQKNEQQGFTQLVNLYSKRIYNYFLRLSNNQDLSEDLTSDVFLKVVQNIKKLKNDNFSAWIFKIASNCFFDYLREKQRHNKFLDNLQPPIEEFNENSEAQTKETQVVINKELARLDDETRDLIILRFYSNLSFKEIAAIKSMPIGTVLSKIHRALKELKLSLGDKI